MSNTFGDAERIVMTTGDLATYLSKQMKTMIKERQDIEHMDKFIENLTQEQINDIKGKETTLNMEKRKFVFGLLTEQ